MPSDPASTRTTMAEDYLKVIWKAEEWVAPGSPGITTNEIAATLGVGASTVSGNLRKLERDGFIDYTPYRSIALSERGRHVAGIGGDHHLHRVAIQPHLATRSCIVEQHEGHGRRHSV